jgi:hypothetical protein
VKTLAALAAAAVLAAPPAHAETQLVGMVGLTPNAQALKAYVAATYAPPSIGGVRPCDWIGEHCSGRALDFMVYGNTRLGNAIYSDLNSTKAAHNIKYCLWQVPQHYDHVHCTVF